MEQIALWLAPYSSQMTKGMNAKQSELLVGTYLEGLVSLEWLSPKLIAKSRVAFTERRDYAKVTDEMVQFGPKPAEMREIVQRVHFQHAVAEANRIAGLQDGDNAKFLICPEATERCRKARRLFLDLQTMDTFNTPAIEAKAEQLALEHAG